MNYLKPIRFATILALCAAATVSLSAQKKFTLPSPDGKVKAEINVGKTDVTYSVSHSGDIMLAESPLSMTIEGGESFGVNPKLLKSASKSVKAVIDAPIYKKSQIDDIYNEIVLSFKGDYSIIFRAYDDGIAYRFISSAKKPFKVLGEQAVFNFPEDYKAYLPFVRYRPNTTDSDLISQQFFNSFENIYTYIPLSQAGNESLIFAPILVEGPGGKKICVTEADLLNYPGMYLRNTTGGHSLSGVFAPYPKTVKQGGHNMLQGIVYDRENYIAEFKGATAFPWRTVIISGNDMELTNSDMVYKLASANKIGDVSWIKPGKVAWDWWNAWNLYGVDFEAGINNTTYKYYIDFASEYGIEYVILDEGWAVNLQADLFRVVPEIDLEELAAYAKSRNVDLILWAGYYAFERDMEKVCKHYSEMGIKGFKVDFMDHDDQYMVDFHRRSAETAAKYKMMIDFHGTYKPTGLQRTYPNVINFEGVFGLEQMKWNENADQVTYDVTIPFIRMVAGPMDYTQGAMRNATKRNYYGVYSEAMSQGTRCRQLAEYVIFESPLNMLCDSPSNYMNEKECTEYIAGIPTVWDETVAINGEVAKYVTMARRKGDVWYVGSMTNWDARTLEVDLSFLGEGNFTAEVFRDGVNAHRAARDYAKETKEIPADRKMTVKMAPGGGFAMKITKK